MTEVGDSPVQRLLALRQHQRDGVRSPHKPLLVLMALGRLAESGSSAMRWSRDGDRLAELIREFGPPSATTGRQTAAFPFTRLRTDGVWTLDVDVPMDRTGPLQENDPTGRLGGAIEAALTDPTVLARTARALADAEFPPSVASDVLLAVGLDPEAERGPSAAAVRRRSQAWVREVLLAWDRRCAFCGYDGQLGLGSVGIEAAHVRWFTFDGPDDLDNGLALCSLDHKLLDRGALGIDADHRIKVSPAFTARTDTGQRIYDLAGRRLSARPGTPLPAAGHTAWHDRQVFKG